MTKRMGWDVIREIPNKGKDGSGVEITIYRKEGRYSFGVCILYRGRAANPWMGYSVWHNEDPYLSDSGDDAVKVAVEYVKGIVGALGDCGKFQADILALLPVMDTQLSLF